MAVLNYFNIIFILIFIIFTILIFTSVLIFAFPFSTNMITFFFLFFCLFFCLLFVLSSSCSEVFSFLNFSNCLIPLSLSTSSISLISSFVCSSRPFLYFLALAIDHLYDHLYYSLPLSIFQHHPELFLHHCIVTSL